MEGNKPVQCGICQKRFKAEFSLIQHTKSRHQANVFKDVDWRPRRQEAMPPAKASAEVEDEQLPQLPDIEHKDESKPTQATAKQQVYSGSSRLRRVIDAEQCPHCAYYANAKLLKMHISQMHKPKCAAFLCSKCAFASATPDELYAHLKYRHALVKSEAVKVEALICDYVFIPFCKICQFSSFHLNKCECQDTVPKQGATKDWKPRPIVRPPTHNPKMNTIDLCRRPTSLPTPPPPPPPQRNQSNVLPPK